MGSCICRPLFNAVMVRTCPDFCPVTSWSELDARDPHPAKCSFAHLGWAYQRYMQDDSLVDETTADRLRRMKLLTKLMASLVSKALLDYKVPFKVPEWSTLFALNMLHT